MDTWFYWSHVLMHMPWFWRNVHRHHHTFLHPTAFAQDAVHPAEALFQGPMPHHFAACLIPIHPVSHALFGFLTSIYAIAAHDGRWLDLNNHNTHHTYKNVNFGLYWGLWDHICGTRYHPRSGRAAVGYDKLDEDGNEIGHIISADASVKYAGGRAAYDRANLVQ